MPFWTIAVFFGGAFLLTLGVCIAIGLAKRKKEADKEKLEKLIELEDENDGKVE